MVVTTKRGDEGFTYFYELRIRKDSKLIELSALLDILKSYVHLSYARIKTTKLKKVLDFIDTLVLKTYLCLGREGLGCDIDKLIEELEEKIRDMENSVRVDRFRYDFDDISSYETNYVRSLVRLIETKLWDLYFNNEIKNKKVCILWNRASDYLFLLSLSLEK